MVTQGSRDFPYCEVAIWNKWLQWLPQKDRGVLCPGVKVGVHHVCPHAFPQNPVTWLQLNCKGGCGNVVFLGVQEEKNETWLAKYITQGLPQGTSYFLVLGRSGENAAYRVPPRMPWFWRLYVLTWVMKQTNLSSESHSTHNTQMSCFTYYFWLLHLELQKHTHSRGPAWNRILYSFSNSLPFCP